MNKEAKKMLEIAKKYNQALMLKSRRQMSNEVEQLHKEMAPIYMKVTVENGYDELLSNLSMELMLDIRRATGTSVDKKLADYI